MMSEEAEAVDSRSLGVDNRDIGVEAVLYEDGDLTIENDEGEGLILEAQQVRALLGFVVNQPVFDDALDEDTEQPRDSGRCPSCGSGIWALHYGQLEFDGNRRATEFIECRECGAEYRHTWKLVDREVISKGETSGEMD